MSPLMVCQLVSCFNSRAREGRDMPSRLTIGISLSFNSRAREGRDPSRVVL